MILKGRFFGSDQKGLKVFPGYLATTQRSGNNCCAPKMILAHPVKPERVMFTPVFV